MQIKLTQKDIEKAGIQNSASGELIDELAYSADQWTQEDLYMNNSEYELVTPYHFNYENDLLSNTKTLQEFKNISKELEMYFDPQTIQNDSNLQAGAQLALNYPLKWSELLDAYTQSLQEDRTDSISSAYNKALQEEIDDFYDSLNREWLRGDQSSRGVVYEIAKYYTDAREGSYDQKAGEYTFTLNEYDVQEYKDKGYKSNQMKRALIDSIKQSSDARLAKDQEQKAKRRAESERLAVYKKEQEEKAEQERRAKLLSLTL